MSANEADSQSWSVKDVLQWATADFKKRGIESARLEAEILLTETLRVDRVRLVVDSQRPLGADELGQYKNLIQRRRRGEPLAYILGRREFYGRQFKVDRRVLIPRPDTEVLVDVALRRTRARRLFARALDLCTGSGCVAISLARARPTWQVTGSDVSPDALDVARDNALRLGALWGVRWSEGDLFAAVPSEERFELVTSNPPYISATEMAALPADVRDFEPHLALAGGVSGLDFYERLANEAIAHLTRGGVLAVEIGFDQANDVRRLFTNAGFTDVELDRDYGGRDRVISGKAPR